MKLQQLTEEPEKVKPYFHNTHLREITPAPCKRPY